jgi:type II secretory pathway component GspD/PulD (secretin)
MVAVLAISAAGSVRAVAQDQHPQPKPEDSYQALYFNNSTGQRYDNDVQTALRNMLPRAKIYFVLASNALMIRGSAEEIAQAQKMLADLDRPRKTYRVTYTLSENGSSQGAAQHFVLVVDPGSKAFLKQGSRVPIMTGSSGAGSDKDTEVQYVDVGLNLEASIEGYGEGMHLQTKIEESSVADEKSNVGIQDPVLRQSVLQSDSTVTPGKTMVLGSVEMPATGKRMEVSVVAEVVK